MENAANINTWGDQQVEVANTRIPYNSTFVQLRDDDPSKMEGMLMEDTNIPLNLRFVQTKQDDDPNNMESMVMGDLDIPLNGYLVHVETKEGDELMRIVKWTKLNWTSISTPEQSTNQTLNENHKKWSQLTRIFHAVVDRLANIII